jgi:hypothetical protein
MDSHMVITEAVEPTHRLAVQDAGLAHPGQPSHIVDLLQA